MVIAPLDACLPVGRDFYYKTAWNIIKIDYY
jgi:hypothetical protein